jgi:hypothetical protein
MLGLALLMHGHEPGIKTVSMQLLVSFPVILHIPWDKMVQNFIIIDT